MLKSYNGNDGDTRVELKKRSEWGSGDGSSEITITLLPVPCFLYLNPNLLDLSLRNSVAGLMPVAKKLGAHLTYFAWRHICGHSATIRKYNGHSYSYMRFSFFQVSPSETCVLGLGGGFT